MSKKRKFFVGIIILVLIIVSWLVCSTIKSDMLPKSENQKKVQEVAKEVLVSEEADSAVEAPTEKEFTYWGESNDVSVYLMEPEKNQYPAIEMGEGNYTYPWDVFADGYVTQLGNYLEFQFSNFFHSKEVYRKVFKLKDNGTYQVTDDSLVQTLKLKSLLNYEYYIKNKWIDQNEFFLFCEVYGEVNNTVLIRKNIQTGKERHFYFDHNYRLNFPEKITNEEYKNIYFTKQIIIGELGTGLEIWKFNLSDNTMNLTKTVDETFVDYSVAVNSEDEIFATFSLDNEKTWGYFLNTRQYFEIDLEIKEPPVFNKEGVYIRFKYGSIDLSEQELLETGLAKEGLYLLKKDGSKEYKGNEDRYCYGEFYDDYMISMNLSEDYDVRKIFFSYKDNTVLNEKYTHIIYPPKNVKEKTYNMFGWSYEDGKIYGYYVSEDETEIEKFRVN